MSSLAQMWVDEDVAKEPKGWQLRDYEQRGDFDDAEGLCQAVHEESSVGDAVVDYAQPKQLDACPDSGDWDHVLAKAVEVVVEISVASPSATL